MIIPQCFSSYGSYYIDRWTEDSADNFWKNNVDTQSNTN